MCTMRLEGSVMNLRRSIFRKSSYSLTVMMTCTITSMGVSATKYPSPEHRNLGDKIKICD